MSKESMKAKILEYVTTMDWVTFRELQRHLGPESEGDYQWSFAGKNVVVWVGMSLDFTDAVTELFQENKLAVGSADWLTYLLDGGGLTLPLVRQHRSYKKPHWLPLTLRPYDRAVREKKFAGHVQFARMGA